MLADRDLFEEAVTLLRRLSGPDGIRASLSDGANYEAVFTRDAVMAGIAGLMLDDRAIVDALLRTLERLRALQGAEGQVPSNYVMTTGAPANVSFGTAVPRLDAATWYLLGVAFAVRAGVTERGAFRESVVAVVRLLDAIEYNGRHLIYVPVGGNWADEYVYEGYILSDQVLRAWALRLLGDLYAEPSWTAKAGCIAEAIAERYWPNGRSEPYPLVAFSPVARRDALDLAACSLLAVSAVEASRAASALDWIVERFVDRSTLPPAFHPVIDETHPDWPALRRYHLYEFRNTPHEYHNGGVWPIWLGWLAIALSRAGREAHLARLRDRAATALRAPSFRFHEYLHGVSLAPGGMAAMAYSATGVVFLHLADSPACHRLIRA
jgi:hypothetical protein